LSSQSNAQCSSDQPRAQAGRFTAAAALATTHAASTFVARAQSFSLFGRAFFQRNTAMLASEL
jgi:hypothetical protein